MRGRIVLLLCAAALLAPAAASAGAFGSFASAVSDPLPSSEWWLVNVGAAGLTSPGPGKTVVVVDSGMDVSHPAFAGRPNLTMLNPQTTLGREEDHGTEVGSVIGAPSSALAIAGGMVGIYPDAVMDSWDASPSSQLTDREAILGIQRAMTLGQSVVNLSWGSFDAGDPDLERAIERAYKAGLLIVAAAGNDRGHGSRLAYPASYPHVLTVGATDEANVVTPFSSASPHLDLVAPGDDIVVADPQTSGGFSTEAGTSFSSPLVAGIAAWVWTVRPTLDNTQLFELLRRSATDLGPPGFDPDSGYGLVSLPAALAAATPTTDPQEPNEDVDEVKPGGIFGAAGNAPLRTGSATSARLDAGDDPRDLYRIALPKGKRVTVRVGTTGLALSLWGPKTASVVRETPAARKRDLLASGRTSVTVRGTGGVGYVSVSLATGTREAAYRLTVSTR